jgi:hypothetical protein
MTVDGEMRALAATEGMAPGPRITAWAALYNFELPLKV